MLFDIEGNEFRPPHVRVAFLDLDDTITDSKTDWLWATWRAVKNPKGWVEMAWLISMYRGYNRGTLSPERLMRYHSFRAGSIHPVAFRALTLRFFLERGHRHIYPKAALLIQRQKEIGAKVVMLTAQNEMIASPFVQKLGMDDLIASHLELKDTRFGNPIEPYCYGKGKIFWAKKYLKINDVKIEECAFYSDSINDLPLLEMVGHPVVVNPDALLEDEAVQNKWPILRFARPTPNR